MSAHTHHATPTRQLCCADDALQAFLTRTNNQEVTIIALSSSPDGALVNVPCPACNPETTIATHAGLLQEAVLATKGAAASPQHYQAAVATDAQAAAELAADSGLGLALLLGDDDGGTLHTDLVYKTSAYTPEAAVLISRHFKVRHANMQEQS